MSGNNHVNPIGDGMPGADENINVNPMVQGAVPLTTAPDVGEVASGRARDGSTGRTSSNAMPEFINVAQALTVMMSHNDRVAGTHDFHGWCT